MKYEYYLEKIKELLCKENIKYDEAVLKSFIENQGQLFSENIADTPEAAEEFLEDCMATVCSNAAEVKEYLEK